MTGVQTCALPILGCAAAFALSDLLIQRWASGFGVWNFLSFQFGSLAVLCILSLPFFGPGALNAPRPAWTWILRAAGLSGIQAILITASIGIWKDAAGVNVVYATRGLLSVLLVWVIGHRVGNTERHTTDRRVMVARATGASLILAAVALAVKNSGR